MRGNINKEMAKKMKRKKSLESEPGGNQATSKYDHKDKKEKKMVLTLFYRGFFF
jgi:hypothetical protein